MSPKIGVGVEGHGDRAFWSAFLHWKFPGRLFDIQSMNGRAKLIGAASKLLDTFHDLRYAAGIIIMDRDKDPCVPALVDLLTGRFNMSSGDRSGSVSSNFASRFVRSKAGFWPTMRPLPRFFPMPSTTSRRIRLIGASGSSGSSASSSTAKQRSTTSAISRRGLPLAFP